MINTRQTDQEQLVLTEFCDFVNADPIEPGTKAQQRIMQRVMADLRPSQWMIFAKMGAIQAVTGVATLFICPQFGLGFSGHNVLLHTLHESVGGFMFYIICGLIFVFAGAFLSLLILNRDEIRTIRKSKYIYYIVYAFAAYILFFILGSEILIISLVPWVLGAIIGNLSGFGFASKLRLSVTMPR